MSANTTFERRLAALLADEAIGGDPDQAIDQILSLTSRSRPLPRWLALLKEPPMRMSSEVAAGSPTFRRAVTLVLAALVVLVAAGAIVAGATLLRAPALPTPYGMARNGMLAYEIDGDIYTADARGGQTRAIVTGPDADSDPVFSHDGTRFMFARIDDTGAEHTFVARADGTNPVDLIATTGMDWYDWSPDDREIAIYHEIDGIPSVSIAAADGSGVRTLDLGDVKPQSWVSWRPPDGQELLFRGTTPSGAVGLYAIHPDGTGLRSIGATASSEDGHHTFEDGQVSLDGSTMGYWAWENGTAGLSGYGHFRDLDSGVDRLDDAGFLLQFSPDGTSFVYEGIADDVSGSQLYIATLDGSRPGRAIGPVFYYDDRQTFTFSPDGTQVLLTMRHPEKTWIVDVATGRWADTAQPVPKAPSWQRLAP